MFKRIFQKTGIGLKHKVSEFVETDIEDSKALALTKPELSHLSRILLGTLISSLTDVLRFRKLHLLLWDHLLLEESNLNLISPASRPMQREWTP